MCPVNNMLFMAEKGWEDGVRVKWQECEQLKTKVGSVQNEIII